MFIKVERVTTNSTNPYFIVATLRKRFFSSFSGFKGKIKKLSFKDFNKQITTLDNGFMTKKKVI